MPFSKEFDDIYQLGIKPACTEAGAYCERLDEQVFDEGMLDRIYNQIAKADIVVADMSKQNPNVFYEVGYAHALDKRVILVTNTAADIPFDLKHRFHIVYDGSIVALRSRLAERLSWYVENPKNQRVGASDHLEFCFGGDALDNAEITLEHIFSDGRLGWRLEISIHNPADGRFGPITCTPTLILPSDLLGDPLFGLYSSSSQIVQLPAAMSAMSSEHPITVQPGGWKNVVFEVIPHQFYRDDLYRSHQMLLRVLSDGPPRDIAFGMTLKGR